MVPTLTYLIYTSLFSSLVSIPGAQGTASFLACAFVHHGFQVKPDPLYNVSISYNAAWGNTSVSTTNSLFSCLKDVWCVN